MKEIYRALNVLACVGDCADDKDRARTISMATVDRFGSLTTMKHKQQEPFYGISDLDGARAYQRADPLMVGVSLEQQPGRVCIVYCSPKGLDASSAAELHKFPFYLQKVLQLPCHHRTSVGKAS